MNIKIILGFKKMKSREESIFVPRMSNESMKESKLYCSSVMLIRKRCEDVAKGKNENEYLFIADDVKMLILIQTFLYSYRNDTGKIL